MRDFERLYRGLAKKLYNVVVGAGRPIDDDAAVVGAGRPIDDDAAVVVVTVSNAAIVGRIDLELPITGLVFG